MTAEKIDSARALHIGLVHEVVPDAAALLTWEERLKADLCVAAPSGVAASKSLIRAVAGQAITPALISDTV